MAVRSSLGLSGTSPLVSDFQGVPKGMSDQVFEQLHKRLKLERHQVMFTFSHNHCGPRLGDDLVDYYPVVDYALRFKREYGPGTWVFGYADDMVAYMPSRRVWEEGGYEGGSTLFEFGRPALRWSGDIEDRIATSVHKLVMEVRK